MAFQLMDCPPRNSFCANDNMNDENAFIGEETVCLIISRMPFSFMKVTISSGIFSPTSNILNSVSLSFFASSLDDSIKESVGIFNLGFCSTKFCTAWA